MRSAITMTPTISPNPAENPTVREAQSQADYNPLAKQKAAEEAMTRAKIENCARAKSAKTTFESGARVGRVNAAGEREIMDDADRAVEAKRLQSIVASDCN